MGMIPEGWRPYKLGDVCSDISYGYTESASLDKIGPKFLRITDIQNYFTDWNNVPYCPISNSNHSKYKLERGDIVIARTGATTGVTTVFKDESIDAVFASYLIRYRINKRLANPFYVGYILKSAFWKSHLNSIIGGSAQPGANAKQFAAFDFLLPTLTEQSRIASILSSLDDKIELNLQMNKTLEAIAQAIFKEWFMDFQFPGSDGVLVDGLPKGWRMRKLNQVAQVEIGRTPPRMENQWFSIDNKDIKWISIRDMGNSGIFIFNTSEYLTLAAIEKFRIPVIPPNTVVLSFKLTIGRVGITTERMVSNEAIAQIKSDTLDSGFIYCLLKNYHFDSLGSTSSIATAINSKIIKEMEVLVPEQKVVDEFCRIAGPVFNKIKNNSLEIKTVTEIRDSLLPKLMTGKIKVA